MSEPLMGMNTMMNHETLPITPTHPRGYYVDITGAYDALLFLCVLSALCEN